MMIMTTMTRRMVGAAAVGVLFATSVALAQAPAPAPPTPPVRIRGTIEKVDGQMLTVKAKDGASMMVKVADNGPVRNIVKASLADIQAGSYLAITAMPQPDGSQKAVAILIFPAGPKPPDGFSNWDFMPGSTMTNATVDNTVASVDGQKLVVKYKDGEKTIVVPPNAEITTFKAATMADVKPGEKIFIFAAKKLPDGGLEAPNIAFGDYGVWR
jgi:outer membrane lipoprotein SlyB